MADVKISGLPAATTPVAGSEVLPIVQSGVTKKVSIDNLTAGKAVSASSLTATNLKTSPATANLDISGTTIAASGSDANVDVNINAKGSGVAYLNQRWGVNQSGALVASAGNTYDIGNGTNNPRDVNIDRYAVMNGLTASKGVFTDASKNLSTTGTLNIDQGGTGQTSAQTAINALAGATTSGQYLRGNGSNVVMSAIQAGDVPTLNQDTTGSAGSVKSNATTGLMQITGPAAGQTRVVTIPNANATMARTDAGQTFSGDQSFNSTGSITLPVGTTAQRPGSPTTGMIRYNTDQSEYEVYDDGSWNPLLQGKYFSADFLVVAGGGGGCTAVQRGGGGGGGGYRTSAGTRGGGASAESALKLVAGSSYTVTVGAGGSPANPGSNSIFGPITSIGGGRGGNSTAAGGSGGSGGGGGNAGGAAGTGTASQGYNGGSGAGFQGGGGGGGAGSVGGNSSGNTGGNGGSGVASSITGSSVARAGGGGGSAAVTAGTASDGGGAGAISTNGATSGTVNTGGGGGAAWDGSPSGSGGSGFVVVKYPDTLTISNPGGGLTFTTSSAGGFKVTEFTAGTGVVQFA